MIEKEKERFNNIKLNVLKRIKNNTANKYSVKLSNKIKNIKVGKVRKVSRKEGKGDKMNQTTNPEKLVHELTSIEEYDLIVK